MSESNRDAEPSRSSMQSKRVNGNIICPVCRSEILEGEVVCWVCYGGQPVSARENGTSTGSTLGYIFGSIFAGIAISLGSVIIGALIAILTILAMIESFFESLGCVSAILTFGCIGWGLIDISITTLGCFF